MSADSKNTSSGSFADLFEAEAGAQPRLRQKTLRLGDAAHGRVVQIGKDAVFVELVDGRQAFVDASELRRPDGTLTVKVGDPFEASVVAIDAQSDEIRLGRSLGKAVDVSALENAREAGLSIEGKVTGVNKGGLEVTLASGVRGFCPLSQVDDRFVEDAASYVGRTLAFLVSEVRDGGKGVVLSRRALLEQESRERSEKVLGNLNVGAVIRGSVSSVRDFGAFVDLGGIEGLIPRSELSHDRSAKAQDLVQAGDIVDVQVRAIETTEKRGRSSVQVTLSLKALAPDPWQTFDAVSVVDTVIEGTITRAVDFGLFVRIAHGIEGLVHVSELSTKEQRDTNAFSAGQGIRVVVKHVDREQKKVSLALAPDGALTGTRARAAEFPVGAIVTAVVDRVEPYGVFVQIEGTKGRNGRGLIPNAELGTARGDAARKSFPEGTRVTAKVLETGAGRLRLSIRAVRDDEERAEYEGYREESSAPAKLGTLGEMLASRKAEKRSK